MIQPSSWGGSYTAWRTARQVHQTVLIPKLHAAVSVFGCWVVHLRVNTGAQAGQQRGRGAQATVGPASRT